MSWIRSFGGSPVLLAILFSPTTAQTPTQLLNAGVQAYRDLDYGAAAVRLQRAAQRLPIGSEDRRRALSYLGASEIFRGRPDSAAAPFQLLLYEDPRFRLDELTFPPEVTVVFSDVRRRTFAVVVDLPDALDVPVRRAFLPMRLITSTPHTVDAVVRDSTGNTIADLHHGRIADSLDVRWSLIEGTEIHAGNFLVEVTSRNGQGTSVRTVEIPLSVEMSRTDTIIHPIRPADSLLLPETESSSSAAPRLAVGLGAGAAVLVLPQLVASDADLSATRFIVAGTVSLAGILGFLTPSAGRPIPENAAANQIVVERWEEQLDATVTENRRRVDADRVFVRRGTSRTFIPDYE